MLGAIFDLDGTLLDTLQDIARVCNTVFGRMGIGPKTTEQYRPWIGRGLKSLIQSALNSSHANIDEVWTRIIEEYTRNPVVYTKPYPGISSLLRNLSKLCPIAVLSNKEDHLAKKLIAHCFPSIAFKEVRGLSREYPAKPDPTQALLLADILGVPPSNIYFVGDSPYDVKTAERAAMIPVIVNWGYIDSEYFHNHTHTMCHDPREIYRLISSASEKGQING